MQDSHSTRVKIRPDLSTFVLAELSYLVFSLSNIPIVANLLKPLVELVVAIKEDLKPDADCW